MGQMATRRYLSKETADGLGLSPVADLVELGAQLESSIAIRQSQPRPSFSIEILSTMDWLRFELLVQLYFEHTGYRVVRTGHGPDGGIDMRLYLGDATKPDSIVQCKRKQQNGYVSATDARAFAFVVSRERAPQGRLITTGRISAATQREIMPSVLVTTGDEISELLNALPPTAQASIRKEVFAGDWITPSCVTCGRKEIHDSNNKNQCRDHPCRNTRSLFVQPV